MLELDDLPPYPMILIHMMISNQQNKVQSSDISLKDVVEQDVKEKPMMLCIKRVPEFPQRGFSSLAVRVLKQYREFDYFTSFSALLRQISHIISLCDDVCLVEVD